MTDTAPRTTDAAPAPIRRLRVAAAVLALIALAFSQAPGRLIGDTKSDLVLDPGGFLRRALEAWDPQQAFGQVANQSYGYLWPMGPFFWAGHAAGLPGWVVQRGWWSLLLVVAFLGAYRLGGALGIGTPATRLVAALAYALSPRVLSVLGTISVEAWPGAVLPWVLLPLVGGARGRLSPRRAAALSGIAVLCLGGVNAAATAAVLLLPLLYLLTRPRPVRGALLAWWVPVTVLACAWWALPLLVLGRYGYPFLDLIESAAATTSVTGLTDTLRGGEHWLGYLVVHGAPVWTAGWDLATTPGLVVVTALVAAAGLAGLLLPGLPERRWLAGSVLLGTVLITAGHTGVFTGPLAGEFQRLLDGAAAPLRNVHKVDPVLRLPLSLGLAHLLGRAAVPKVRHLGTGRTAVPRVRHLGTGRAAVPRHLGIGLAGVLLAITLLPAWSGRLAPDGSYAATPAYWQQAATWLADHSAGDRALLEPSANAPVYRWGTPRDEPLQALAKQPWAVRDAAPLGAPGSIRMLDGLDQRLATGQPSAAYAQVLARAGVGYVVLRNDLDPDRSGSERPAVIRAALAASPGLTRVAAFGPRQEPPLRAGDRPAGADPDRPPAIEVFAVAGAERVAVMPQAGELALSGGPEGVFPLADAGLLTGRAVMGAHDADADEVVQTDTLRRRAYNSGADPGQRYSATLTAADPVPRPDIGPYDAGEQAVTVLEGASAVTASSSADDPFTAGYLGPDRRPAAAVDGDPATSWVSAGGTEGQWLELQLLRPQELPRARVEVLADPGLGPAVTRVGVTTDAGTVTASVRDGVAELALPKGETSMVRVTINRTDGKGGAVGIRELTIPGVRVRQAVAYPPDDASAPRWSVLAERPDGRRGDCLLGSAGWTCVPGLARPGEESGPMIRRFDAPSGLVEVRATVRPRPGPALNALLDRAAGYRAAGSSTLTADPAARPGAGYDGDPDTAWLPSPADQAPQLRLDLGSTVTLTGFGKTDWTGVGSVDLTTPAGDRRTVKATGRFAPLRTDEVTLTFRHKLGRDGTPLPVTVRDVSLTGAPAHLTRPVEVGCADGPALDLDGTGRRLSVTAPVQQLLTLAPVPATVCGGPVPVAAGPHRLATGAPAAGSPAGSPGAESAGGTGALEVSGVELSSGPLPHVPPARTVTVQHWSDQHRTVRVGAGTQAYLALAEGYNAGWHATADGHPLETKRMDGWQQGFEIPPGSATTVDLTYTPGGTQHRLLLAGLLAALVVVGLALVPGGATRTPARGGAIPLGRWTPAVPVAVLGGLLIGPAGLLAAAVALALPRRARPAGAGGALALAGLLALDPGARGLQAAGQALGAVALCLLAAALTGWRPPRDPVREPVGEPQRRPLDQDPRQPAQQHREDPGEQRDRQHATAEVAPAGDPVDDVEHDQVPEEDPVRDAPQEPQRL
ncbi:MAG TPA: alpha-(1-_3)-arabinofuranosyltransferase family protein [Mycobacteriales bacterium]|nr:alpha-(1->3)-arabinofuranosyltransferase family protein [Mycobacteriales bacterium]